MNIKRTPPAKTDAQRAARSALTLEQASYHFRQGYMSDLEWRWYLFFWLWCAARFGGHAAHRQDRAYKALGGDGLERRRARARALRARLADSQAVRSTDNVSIHS